nr:aldo/keto reductase [Asticcacaulis machinosus]
MRTIGRTTVTVSLLGFGASGIGNLYRAMSDEAGEAVINAAIGAGIRYVDTAPRYGHGLSERRLGTVCNTVPKQDVTLSTKVGRRLTPILPPPPGTSRHGFVDADPFEEHFDYSYDGVMRSFEDSLRRLQRESIDILFAHDLGRMTHGTDHQRHLSAFLSGGYRAMCELRSDGRVGAIGLGVNEWEICADVMRDADLDVVMLAGRYTLLEQAPLDHFLPECKRRGVSVIAAAPFNSGILATGASGPKIGHYNYDAPPPGIIERVRRIEAIARAHDVPLAAAALQFPLGHPVVASVVSGMSGRSQVLATVRLLETSIPAGFWADLISEGLMRDDVPAPIHMASASKDRPNSL